MNNENATESAPGEQGPRGEQGVPGVQGEQGEQGEPGLAIDATITTLVDGALKRAFKWQKRVIGVLAAVIVVLAVNSGYLLQKSITHPLSNQLKSEISSQSVQTKALEQYVQQYAQHGCQALELLSAKPVPKPADPAANPSREVTYEFYQAILYWEHADGCATIAHHVK